MDSYSLKTALTLLIGILGGLFIAQLLTTNVSRHNSKELWVKDVQLVNHPSDHDKRFVNTINKGLKPLSPHYRKDPHEIDKRVVRKKYLKDELHVPESLYIGVMTAAKFIKTRATTVHDTWGHYAPKVEYFTAENTTVQSPLPIVKLRKVEDVYPPIIKAFRMLRYMYDHHINDFKWFMRADDDVYVRVPQMIEFLSTLDYNQDLYIGSPAVGLPKDRDVIKFYPHENYCMGGSGVIFSQALLRKLGPILDDCLKNVCITKIEDVEIGRCISRKLGIQCTWAHEMHTFFHVDYTNGEVYKSPRIYRNKAFKSLLTSHPYKSTEMMYRVHQFFLELEVKKSESNSDVLKAELERIQTKTKRKRAFP